MSRAASLSTYQSISHTPNKGTSAPSSSAGGGQFKHTYLWNNIITHLKKSLVNGGSSPDPSDPSSGSSGGYSHRLRKQHSRFVTGGMLLINKNLLNSTGLTPHSNNLDNICFTGAQCVDIVYSYLTSKDQIANFERQVTREKVTKLCQTIMDTGVFEPVSRSTTRFDDTLLKFYRFKPEVKALGSNENRDNIAKKKSESKDDIAALQIQNSNSKEKKISFFGSSKQTNSNQEDLENNNSNKNIVGLAFNKCKMINKSSMSNTKLKRKVTSMKRSSTIQTLMPVEKLTEISSSNGSISSSSQSSTNQRSDEILQRIDANTIDQLNTQISRSRLDSGKSTSVSQSKYSTSAQELLLTRQITREIVIERLLSIIDLPVIEQLLVIDESNDIDYRDLVERIDSKLTDNTSDNDNENICRRSSGSKSRASSSHRKQSPDSGLDSPASPAIASYAHRSLAILSQTYELAMCDTEREWKKSALECLEFIECPRLSPQNPTSTTQQTMNTILAAKSSLSNAFHHHTSSDSSSTGSYASSNSRLSRSHHQSHKLAQLNKMSELDLYHAIRDHYTQKRHCFLDDSFQPLFAHILSFLRNSQYMRALETLNLGTLLLLKQTQAELKRLLKFLYLTANFTSAPRLAENKQNNSILLNHFAGCLFNTKLIGFEECRLILNFMLNNFDHLFKLNKPLEEAINKRRLRLKKYGNEEALLDKPYCKQLTNQEYVESAKDQTTRALVDLINHIVDDPQISLKQKKLKLKALQRIHPDVYDKYFADLF